MATYEIVGKITNIEVIAAGPGVRVGSLVQKAYGPGRWRKLKETAWVKLPSEVVRFAEIHWYEAHGIGKRDFKIKYLLNEQ